MTKRDNERSESAAEYDLQKHKPICAACRSKMTRLYVRDYDPGTQNHRRTYVGIGWICPECGTIVRD